MLRSLSTRAIAAVAVLLVTVVVLVVAVGDHTGAAARTTATHLRPPGASAPHALAVPVDEAVRRTVAEGTARVQLVVRRNDTGVAAVTVSGVAALSRDDADLAVQVRGHPGGPARLRILGEEAWIGSDDLPWRPVPVTAVRGSSATSFRSMFRQLRADPQGGVTLAGHPATVDLDDHGRIRRVRVRRPSGTFDLHLDGYDADLAIVAPP
jgi:hypothetical protein